MSGAQMAHFLKRVGNGSELEGIVTVYRTGWLVGAGQLLTVVIAAHGVFRLGKWGYEKLVDYLQERGYIVALARWCNRLMENMTYKVISRMYSREFLCTHIFPPIA